MTAPFHHKQPAPAFRAADLVGREGLVDVTLNVDQYGPHCSINLRQLDGEEAISADVGEMVEKVRTPIESIRVHLREKTENAPVILEAKPVPAVDEFSRPTWNFTLLRGGEEKNYDSKVAVNIPLGDGHITSIDVVRKPPVRSEYTWPQRSGARAGVAEDPNNSRGR